MNEALIAYYINLLILQYRTKTKAKATIAAIIRALMIYDLMRKVENGYDPETAIGVQLDILSKYVGISRVVTGVVFDRTYWGCVDYGAATPYTEVAGFIDYAETDPPDAQTLEYISDAQSKYSLTDQELRDIIFLKIGQNMSNHSPASIDDIISGFFGGDAIFTDNKNMAISYIFASGIQRLVEIAIAQGALPKPMAVGLSVSFVPDINNIFGLVDYDASSVPDYLEGLIDYADSPFGGWLTY